MENKITMIELFSGIGAQERALRQLGIPYEVINTCDCDKDAVLSYAAMRNDFANELYYYEFPTQEQMIEELQEKNIGYDFQKSKHTITIRTPIHKLKEYYLADKLSNNLGDISKVERLPRANLVTYSSPCQSFSVAGKLGGAAKTCTQCGHKWDIDFSNPDYNYKCPICGNASLESTTSGLLQEVQRLLSVAYEENELPEYLLLENVKNLVGKKFIGQFEAWVKWLDNIGYNTYWKVINSKHMGIPQNRERVFAISIRKDIDDCSFKFPEQITLTTRLKDVLEHNVDEKYYLPDERIEKILNSTFMQEKKRIQVTDVCDTLLARDWKDPKCVPVKDEIKIVGNYMPSNHDASRVVDIEGIAPTVKENHGTVTAIAEPQIIQKFGDRGTSQYSVRDYAHTIPVNPMSDRGQMVLESQVIKVGQVSSDGSQAGMVYSPDGLAPTLCAGCHGYAMGNILEEQEPFIVASRGRNPENPSDRTVGSPTEQRLEPNFSGCTNTLTSVQKDNYVVEPIVYDDYNSRISADQNAINTLTSNCGASAERNGVKIIESVIVEYFYQSREPRVYNETAPTIRSERTGLKVADGDIDLKCLNSKGGRNGIEGLQPSLTDRVYDSNGVATACATSTYFMPGYLVSEGVRWRIRKLTTKECWRLMGFTDSDHDRAANYVSASSLYKQAGNSICTCCLVGIFNSLFNNDNTSNYAQHLVNFND